MNSSLSIADLGEGEQYLSDAVIKFGFWRGLEPVNYIANILERFNHYKQFVVT